MIHLQLIRLALIPILTVLLGGPTAAQTANLLDPMRSPPVRGFVSHQLANSWEEALISGNGTIGVLVTGNPLNERITFNHEQLFMPWDASGPVVPLAPQLGEVRNAIKAGRFSDAAEFVWQLAGEQGYDQMRWTDPLVPAFDLVMTMEPKGEVRNFLRAVDFQTGVASVRWEDDRGTLIRQTFVSRADNVAVISLRSQTPGMIGCRCELSISGQHTEPDGGHPGTPVAKPNANAFADGSATEEDPSFHRGISEAEIKSDGACLTYYSRV
ncbi:MAG: glycoside hydrolase N-terminal domain-containing protein, partial [Planctomycetota bacterium]